jgi:enoyl-[acyl-carrier-protein] reductase (NADH)
MPLDVRTPGQLEAVFERIAKDWGELDFVIHSIAFLPKDTLCGRVVDVRSTSRASRTKFPVYECKPAKLIRLQIMS